MQKTTEHLNKAIKSIKIADRMTYISYPLIKEQKLLLKILDEIYKSIIYLIIAINNENNLNENNIDLIKSFINNNYKKLSLEKRQIMSLYEIIEVYNKHKLSAIEFVKNEKVVIMSDNFNINTLDINKIKEYLLVAKELLKITLNF